MTRPQIVRADTIDLQDQDAPSASDHTKQPAHPAPLGIGPAAPHQQAQVQHVLDERHSEEQALSDAWHGENGANEEPDEISDKHSAEVRDGAEPQSNGTQTNGVHTEGQEAEGAESEAESADDDMMDRISSSPSIDDGVYTLNSSPTVWPARKASLSPMSTPTRRTLNRSATSTPESSPFVETPTHLPLRRVLAESETANVSPSQQQESSSPFIHAPRHLPISIYNTAARERFHLNESDHHHLTGEYPLDPPDGLDGLDEGFFDDQDDALDEGAFQQSESHLESPLRSYQFSRSVMNLATMSKELLPSPSWTSLASVDSMELLQQALLPTDDPLLDIPPSQDGSDDEWNSTDSEDWTQEKICIDDDAEDISFPTDERFVDSGWGGECLRDTEDIDFEFVYALHTFVATVEGQANATKGDTMVLLDDSNSYWWLVRVVKDGSIGRRDSTERPEGPGELTDCVGYLPAEHIETPTERLARLNKHRNIDLSATMLGDNPEKTKNPLKKAMRRRNAKTVQFAAPTYVEASDYDYSTEDEEHAMIEPSYLNGAAAQAEEPTQDEPTAEAEEAHVSGSREGTPTLEQQVTVPAPAVEEPLASPKLVDKSEAAPLKSRKGTVRNTDSFLKDDTIETRKITLTPGLLREDSISSKSPESTRNNSMESLTKTTSPPEKQKDTKVKKEKKQGMLSGLFKSKKKDKKAKDDDASEAEKPSLEISRNSPRASPMPSGDSSPVERTTQPAFPDNKPAAAGVAPSARQPTRGKLQKSPPSNTSSPVREPSQQPTAFLAELEGSEVAHEAPTGQEDAISDLQRRIDAEPSSDVQERARSPQQEGPFAPITNMLKTSDKSENPKKAKRAKQRVELDDFDSPVDDTKSADPFADQEEDEDEKAERLSESPIEISNTFMHGTESIHIPTPGFEGPDTEEDEEEPESLTSSPSIIEHPAEPVEESDLVDEDPTPTARSPLAGTAAAPTTPHKQANRQLSADTTGSTHFTLQPSPVSSAPWSDTDLRSWLDGDNDVKDMLVIIHDKSGVVPVSADHPMMSGLFEEQRKSVQGMMGELDGLLGDFMKRKGTRIAQV